MNQVLCDSVAVSNGCFPGSRIVPNRAMVHDQARPSLARALHDRSLVLGTIGRAGDADRDEHLSNELGKELGLRDTTFA